MENNLNNIKNNSKKGFTLLELLIVIAIIAILAGTVLTVINPSELLKKSRDSKRVSDLTSLRDAIGLYVTEVRNPQLDGTSTENLCQDHIWYSNLYNFSTSCPSGKVCIHPSSTASSTKIDSTGWVPVNFASIQEGSPISSLPLDPKNNSNYYYTYACDESSQTFEMDAKFESQYYATVKNLDDRDGGDVVNCYEVGTDPGLDLMGISGCSSGNGGGGGSNPPVANFSASPTNGDAPLSVSFTDQSTNNPTSWSWNFGDGQTATTQNPNHTYSNSGIYDVSLTVSNSDGTSTLERNDYIYVTSTGGGGGSNPPVANFSASPTNGDAPLSVSFTDQSTNNPTSWSWNFGDGQTATTQNPNHTYSNSGIYDVSLTVSNSDGTSTLERNDYIYVTSTNSPTTDFLASPLSGCVPLTVNFTDQSTNNPTAWYWNFNYSEEGGEGGGSPFGYLAAITQNPVFTYYEAGNYSPPLAIGTGGGPPPQDWTTTTQNPVFTYYEAGNYSVSLTVSTTYDDDNEIKTNYINVNDSPHANFTASPICGDAPLSVSFTDQSTNNPTSWSWNFGDGTISTEENPTHTYNSVGKYTVSLTVSNNCGNYTETKTDYIESVDGSISYSISYGSGYAFNDDTSDISVSSLDSTHFVIAYEDGGNNNYGTAIIGTISNGNQISYGSEYVFNSATTWHISVSSLDSTHFVIAYEDVGSYYYGTAIIGAVSNGNQISYGYEYVFNNSGITFCISVSSLDSTHFVVAYTDRGNNDYGTAIIGTISNGNQISYGSEYVFNNASTNYYISVSSLDSTHFVVAYTDRGNNDYGTAIIGTISNGNQISYGSEYVFNSASSGYISVSSLDSTHFVVAYSDNGNNDYGTAIIGTISNENQISYGSEYVFNNDTTLYISVSSLDSTHFVVAYEKYQDIENNYYSGMAIIGTVSNENQIFYGCKYVFDSIGSELISVSSLDSTHFVIAYRENYNYSPAIIGKVQ